MIRMIETLAWLSLISALGGSVYWASQSPAELNAGLFVGSLFALVSAAIIYACRKTRAGADIGAKALPATLVAYLLVSLIAYRWLSELI
ncbi:MAG: hypothetical protein OIF38_11260 [Cellvibrionaceae bacterium]|nr:hypothetical protein [Cellvibrionaceae bacterium]